MFSKTIIYFALIFSMIISNMSCQDVKGDYNFLSEKWDEQMYVPQLNCMDRAIADACRTDWNHTHAAWIPGISEDSSYDHYYFDRSSPDTHGIFVEFPNPNEADAGYVNSFYDGTAIMTGVIRAILDENKAFLVYAEFSDRVNPDDPGYDDIDPKEELADICYDRYVDTDEWYYYEELEMVLYGLGDWTGLVLDVSRNPFYPPQVGYGANSMNIEYGISFWFDWVVRCDHYDVSANPLGFGDFNIELFNCDYDECVTVVDPDPTPISLTPSVSTTSTTVGTTSQTTTGTSDGTDTTSDEDC